MREQGADIFCLRGASFGGAGQIWSGCALLAKIDVRSFAAIRQRATGFGPIAAKPGPGPTKFRRSRQILTPTLEKNYLAGQKVDTPTPLSVARIGPASPPERSKRSRPLAANIGRDITAGAPAASVGDPQWQPTAALGLIDRLVPQPKAQRLL